MTVTQGTNRIVGNDPGRIVREALAVLGNQTRRGGEGETGRGNKAGRVPELWDGSAAERIVKVLREGI